MEFVNERTGTLEIGRRDCLRLLAQHQGDVGRVAFVQRDEPLIFPVNFAMVSEMVVFRTGVGTKLDAALEGARMAFELDRIDLAARTGWSVVVRGHARVITSPNELFALRATPLRSFVDTSKDGWVMIDTEVISGRRVPDHGMFVLHPSERATASTDHGNDDDPRDP